MADVLDKGGNSVQLLPDHGLVPIAIHSASEKTPLPKIQAQYLTHPLQLKKKENLSGNQVTFQFSTNTSGPWQGQSSSGTEITIDTHDIYTAGAIDSAPQGTALLTFADNNRCLCSVESVSPTIDVVSYEQPYPKLSIENDAVTQSDWNAYPIGSLVLSIEAYVLNNDLTAPGFFKDGLWSLARQTPAFPQRIGGVIAPFAVVVHTTDTVPEAYAGLVHNWTTAFGRGECAHFIVGRDQTTT